MLARVKAMHAAGIQGSEGGVPPASSPFLSPASAAFSTSNSFTSVTVTERTQTQGETTVLEKETVTVTKDGQTTVKEKETTTRIGEFKQQDSTTEEVDNG